MVSFGANKSKTTKDTKKEKSTSCNPFMACKKSNKKYVFELDIPELGSHDTNRMVSTSEQSIFSNEESAANKKKNILKKLFKKNRENKNTLKRFADKTISMIKKLVKLMVNFFKNNCYKKGKRYFEILVGLMKKYYNRFRDYQESKKQPLLGSVCEHCRCYMLGLNSNQTNNLVEIDLSELETTARTIYELPNGTILSQKAPANERPVFVDKVCVNVNFSPKDSNIIHKQECIEHLKNCIVNAVLEECKGIASSASNGNGKVDSDRPVKEIKDEKNSLPSQNERMEVDSLTYNTPREPACVVEEKGQGLTIKRTITIDEVPGLEHQKSPEKIRTLPSHGMKPSFREKMRAIIQLKSRKHQRACVESNMSYEDICGNSASAGISPLWEPRFPPPSSIGGGLSGLSAGTLDRGEGEGMDPVSVESDYSDSDSSPKRNESVISRFESIGLIKRINHSDDRTMAVEESRCEKKSIEGERGETKPVERKSSMSESIESVPGEMGETKSERFKSETSERFTLRIEGFESLSCERVHVKGETCESVSGESMSGQNGNSHTGAEISPLWEPRFPPPSSIGGGLSGLSAGTLDVEGECLSERRSSRCTSDSVSRIESGLQPGQEGGGSPSHYDLDEEIDRDYARICRKNISTEEGRESAVDALLELFGKIDKYNEKKKKPVEVSEPVLYEEIGPETKILQTVGVLPVIPEGERETTSQVTDDTEAESNTCAELKPDLSPVKSEGSEAQVVNIAKDPPSRSKKNKRSPNNKNKSKSPKWKLIKSTLYSSNGSKSKQINEEDSKYETERHDTEREQGGFARTDKRSQEEGYVDETKREETQTDEGFTENNTTPDKRRESKNDESELKKQKQTDREQTIEELYIRLHEECYEGKVTPNIEIYNYNQRAYSAKYDNEHDSVEFMTQPEKAIDVNVPDYSNRPMTEYAAQHDLVFNGIKLEFENIQCIRLSYFHPLFTLRGPIMIDNEECVGVQTEFDEIYFKLPNLKFKTPNSNEQQIEIYGPCFVNKIPQGKAIRKDGEVAYFPLPVFPAYYWYYDHLFKQDDLLVNKDGLSVDLFPIKTSNLFIINGMKSEAAQSLSEIFHNYSKLSSLDQVRLASILGTEEIEPFIAVDMHIKYAVDLRWTDLDWGAHMHYYKKNYNYLRKDSLIENGFNPERLNLMDARFIHYSNNNAMMRKKLLVEIPMYNYSPIQYRLQHREKTSFNRIGSAERITLRFRLVPRLNFPFRKPTTEYGTVDDLMEFKNEDNIVRIPFGYNYEPGVWDEMKRIYDLHFSYGHINTLYRSQSRIINYQTLNGLAGLSNINSDSRCICDKIERPCPFLSIAKPSDFVDPSSFLKVYGDPMFEARMKSNSSTQGESGAKPPGESGEDLSDVNGNWTCTTCKNVNFPKRTLCNKCSLARDQSGTKCVADYANIVHKDLIKLVSIYATSNRSHRRHKYKHTDNKITQHLDNSTPSTQNK